jgi:hypothetical protein
LPENIPRLVLLSKRATLPEPETDMSYDAADETVVEQAPEQQQPLVPTAHSLEEPDEALQALKLAEDPSPESPEPAVEEPPTPTCHILGPIPKQKTATIIVDALSDDYRVNMRTTDVRQPAGYWVYMPSMQRGEALRIVADLDAHGMKDYYIGKQNYLSLGIFSDKDKAERRRKQIERIGYDALVDERFRTRQAYWIDIEEQEKPLADSDAWQQIQAAYADLSLQEAECE